MYQLKSQETQITLLNLGITNKVAENWALLGYSAPQQPRTAQFSATLWRKPAITQSTQMLQATITFCQSPVCVSTYMVLSVEEQ